MTSNVVGRRLASSLGQSISHFSGIAGRSHVTPNSTIISNALMTSTAPSLQPLHNNTIYSNAYTSAMPQLHNNTITQQTRNYHESVIDHFNKPRNVGKLDSKKKSVGSAIVGKASCGDVIKLQIDVSSDGKIKDAKFKTFGCGSAIASSSLATEMIIGQNVNEAAKLKNTDISSHLNLPPVKIHCSVLAEEAIQAAIQDYKTKNE